MKRVTTIVLFIFLAFTTTCFQSCVVLSPKAFNQLSNDKAFDKGIDKLHQKSMTSNNIDSVYCNFDLFLSTMAFYRKDLANIKFSNQGLERVRTDLIMAYDKYKRYGSIQPLNVYSELELKEKVSEYLKWAIDDSAAGNNNYHVKGIFEFGETIMKPKNKK